jgi:hypothetical protein
MASMLHLLEPGANADGADQSPVREASVTSPAAAAACQVRPQLLV